MKTRPVFHRSARLNSSGFTLIEMLVVMAIIAIIATASVTAFRSVNSALGLSTAGQLIASEITTARQTALTFSEEVEVRFYYYTDSITGASQYNAVQSFSTTDGTNFTQLDRISYLPPSIMISQSTGGTAVATALSYPFQESNATVNPFYLGTITAGALPIPAVGLNYKYKVLRFKPGGSVDYVIPTAGAPASWPPSSWYITLFEKKYSGSAVSAIKNYLTINVDSTDGRVRTFQP